MTRFGRTRILGLTTSDHPARSSLLRTRSRRQLLSPPIPPQPENAAAVWWANDLEGVEGDPVSSWTDRVSINSLTGSSTTRPLLSLTGAASRPIVEFDGTDDYLSTTTIPSTSSTGCMIAVMRWDDPTRAGSIQSPFGASTSSTSTRLVRVSNNGTSGNARVARNNSGSGSTNSIDGGSSLGTSLMVLEISSTGSAYEIRRNNAVETLTVASGSNNGAWFDTVPLLDRFYMGSETASTIRFPFDGGICYLGVFNSQLSGADRSALYNWIADYYTITM